MQTGLAGCAWLHPGNHVGRNDDPECISCVCEIPDDTHRGDLWDNGMASARHRVSEKLADVKPSLGFAQVLCNYRTDEGLHLEKAKIAFDIQVADTHNYIANDVLVSNCNSNSGRHPKRLLIPSDGMDAAPTLADTASIKIDYADVGAISAIDEMTSSY
jgi:hypothetical protein